jgi:hypothetical protein
MELNIIFDKRTKSFSIVGMEYDFLLLLLSALNNKVSEIDVNISEVNTCIKTAKSKGEIELFENQHKYLIDFKKSLVYQLNKVHNELEKCFD